MLIETFEKTQGFLFSKKYTYINNIYFLYMYINVKVGIKIV